MTAKSNRLDFATRCIHAGQAPDPATGAVMMPIYTTSTFVQQSPGVHKGFDYARTKNPTRMAFERCVADLEGGSHAAVFASGLAAEHAVLQAYLRPDDEVVVPADVYGGTYRLLARVFAPLGVRMRAVDTTGVAPLYTPLSAVQDVSLRLRDDVVTEGNQREANQQSAPAVEGGLFLVPKVIE